MKRKKLRENSNNKISIDYTGLQFDDYNCDIDA